MGLRFSLRDYGTHHGTSWPRALQAVLLDGGEWYQNGEPCGFFPYVHYPHEQEHLHRPCDKWKYNAEQFGYSAEDRFRLMGRRFSRDEEDVSRFVFSLERVFEQGGDLFSPLEVLSALPARDFKDFSEYVRFLHSSFARFRTGVGDITPCRVRDELLRGYEFRIDPFAHLSTFTSFRGKPSKITVEPRLDRTTFAHHLLHEITHGIMHHDGTDPVTHREAHERCIDFAAATALSRHPCLHAFSSALFDHYRNALQRNKYLVIPFERIIDECQLTVTD